MKYAELSLDLFKGRKYRFTKQPPENDGVYIVKENGTIDVIKIERNYKNERVIFDMGWDCSRPLEGNTNTEFLIFIED